MSVSAGATGSARFESIRARAGRAPAKPAGAPLAPHRGGAHYRRSCARGSGRCSLRGEDCPTARGRAALRGREFRSRAVFPLSSRATIAAWPPDRLRRRGGPAGGSGSLQQRGVSAPSPQPSPPLRGGEGEKCCPVRVKHPLPRFAGRGGEMLPSPRQTPSPPLRGGEGEKCCPSSQTPSPPLRGGEEEMLCDPWRELPLTPTLSPASRGRRGKCCPPPRGEEGGPREREGARRGGRSGSVARRRRERLAGALYLPVHEHVPRDIPCSMTHAHALSRPPSAVAHSAAVRQPPDGTIPR